MLWTRLWKSDTGYTRLEEWKVVIRADVITAFDTRRQTVPVKFREIRQLSAKGLFAESPLGIFVAPSPDHDACWSAVIRDRDVHRLFESVICRNGACDRIADGFPAAGPRQQAATARSTLSCVKA